MESITTNAFGPITIFNKKEPSSKIAHVFTSTMYKEDYIQKIHKIIKWYKAKWNMKWDVIVLNDGLNIEACEELVRETDCTIIAFDTYLGRRSLTDYPYEWRNLYYIKTVLEQYDKVIFMANDFYVLQENMMIFLNNWDGDQWVAFWSPTYNMAESACQIITKNCKDYNQFVANDNYLERSPEKQYEEQAPFTHIEKRFKGDRYGELCKPEELTEDMVYWAQASLEHILR